MDIFTVTASKGDHLVVIDSGGSVESLGSVMALVEDLRLVPGVGVQI